MSLEKCSLKPQWETTSHLRLLQCKDQKQQHIIRVDRINKWWENVETLEPCILLGRMEDDVATVEKSSQIPQKVKITIWPENTIPRSKYKKVASMDSNRCFYMNIHTSTIYNSQKGDAPQKFIRDQRKNKLCNIISYPSNNTDLNCTGPLTTGFSSRNTYYGMSRGFWIHRS